MQAGGRIWCWSPHAKFGKSHSGVPNGPQRLQIGDARQKGAPVSGALCLRARSANGAYHRLALPAAAPIAGFWKPSFVLAPFNLHVFNADPRIYDYPADVLWSAVRPIDRAAAHTPCASIDQQHYGRARTHILARYLQPSPCESVCDAAWIRSSRRGI